MKNIVNFLAPHVPEVQPVPFVSGVRRCGFSGVPLTSGVPIKKVIRPATANIADTFKYPSDYVSGEVASLFKAQTALRGNMFVTAEGIQRPLFSVESARSQARPSWLDVFMNLSKGSDFEGVLVLTDESKRRLWPEAVVSEWRQFVNLFYNVGSTSRVLTLRTAWLTSLLRSCTLLLTLGYSRVAVQESLSKSRDLYREQFPQSYTVDRGLGQFRNEPEFDVALYTARDISELPETDKLRQWIPKTIGDFFNANKP